MARRKRQELIDAFSAMMGENGTSDEAIGFLEDLSDSVNDDLQSEYDTLKASYDKLDGEWRERYVTRFKNIGTEPDTSDVIEKVQPEDDTTVVDEAEENRVNFDDIVL